MRCGSNPVKDTGATGLSKPYRIVLPVYIPHHDGYFEQSLQVLKLSLESLHLTGRGQFCVSVVANGCSRQVVEELDVMFRHGWIDHLVLSRLNLGKAGAIASVLKGAPEQLLAWSDCDVLFKMGWVEAVVEVFQAFPECGAVTPFPAVHQAWEFTSATTMGGFVGRCLCRAGVVPTQDLDEYARSVGTPTLFREEYRRSPWIACRAGVQACLGAMHFVCCVRREVLSAMPDRASTAALKGTEDNDFLDLPPERLGLWRLSTVQGHVWHMGNTVEPWMVEHVAGLRSRPEATVASSGVLPPLKRGTVSRLPLGARRLGARILRRILERTLLVALKRKLGRSFGARG
jgi:hypothetical protein